MTITRDTSQDCSGFTSSGTSATATFPVAATAGKLLIATALLSTPVANVTIPSGWATLVSKEHGSGTFCAFLCWKVAAGGETGAAFSMPGQPNGDVDVAAFQLSAALAVSPQDASASNMSNSSVTTLPTGTTGALAQADEVVITAAVFNGPVTSPTWTNAGTPIRTVNSKLTVGQRTVAVTTAVSDTCTWTGSAAPCLVIGTFKAAPAGIEEWWTVS